MVGYVFGDYCLFNSYVIFGAKFGQLFMTIAPPIAGIAGFLLLLCLTKELRSAGTSLKDRSGMLFTLLATIFGSNVGVTLSLMAVEHANAGIASTLMALTPVLIIVPYSLIYKQRIKFQEVVGTLVTVFVVAMFFSL